MFSFQSKGRTFHLTRPWVMGILNVTPDSFYAESRADNTDRIIEKAKQMVSEGASILDIGGQSTRPGAALIPPDVELNRVIPAIQALRQLFPEIILSIDTFYAKVAAEAIAAGADMVNDISAGLRDEEMIPTVASLKLPFIAMHSRGTPQTMQDNTQYEAIVDDLLFFFKERINTLEAAGIRDIIVDPGFGFAKTREQNFEILHHLDRFHKLGKPLLVGLSRKSMIYKTLQIKPEEALNGTSVLHTIALMKGTLLLRVHDVKEAMECIELVDVYHVLYINKKNRRGWQASLV